MFPHSNIHSHTTWSDGHDSPRQMIEAALSRGFAALGISDHGYSPWDECAMPQESEAAYRAEVRALAEEYAGRIEIALGYEHDATMPDTDLTLYDYAIESVHFVPAGAGFCSVDESETAQRQCIRDFYGGDPYRYCAAYFDGVCEALARTKAQVAGHLDLVSKFNEGGRLFDTADPRYAAKADEALRVACERDQLVEINTGAMSRGYRKMPYPEPRLLKQLREWGGRVILSSDCHRAEWLDYGFAEALALARECGFREIWIWKDGTFRATGIDKE